VTDDWNPNDPDATRVHYDLARWTFDQQAELAAELAEAGVPHTWDGTELVVPEEVEVAADSIIANVEQRLGISDDGVLDDIDREPLPLQSGIPTTEYDLADWTSDERDAVSAMLADGEVPYGWNDATLLVSTDDEEAVDAVLDAVEKGGYTGGLDPDLAVDDELAEELFEILTTFFLAGDRLKRNPLDAEGLEDLVRALEVADPAIPPYGVERRLWGRSCELAEELVEALVGDEPPDHDEATRLAGELHDLLRPYI